MTTRISSNIDVWRQDDDDELNKDDDCPRARVP
ncbi:unnamed protein product, partial [Rotaria magnacalcarata]